MAGLVSQSLTAASRDRRGLLFVAVALQPTILQALGFLWLEGIERALVDAASSTVS